MLNFPSRRGTGSRSRGVQAKTATFSEAISKRKHICVQRCRVISNETLLGALPVFGYTSPKRLLPPAWSCLTGVCSGRMSPVSPGIYSLGAEGGRVSPGATPKGSFSMIFVGAPSPIQLSSAPGGHREICRNSRFPQALEATKGLGRWSPCSHSSYFPLLSLPPRLFHPVATGLVLEGA